MAPEVLENASNVSQREMPRMEMRTDTLRRMMTARTGLMEASSETLRPTQMCAVTAMIAVTRAPRTSLVVHECTEHP